MGNENYQAACKFYNQKKYQEAIDCFGRKSKWHFMNIEELYILSMSLLHVNRHNEMKKYLDRILMIPPKTYRAYFLTGCILHAWNKQQESLNALQTCAQLKSDYQPVYRMQGLVYASLKQYDLAIAMFQKALTLGPDFEIYLQYGKVLDTMGRDQEALTNLQESIKLNPHHSETHYHMGLLLFTLKDYEQAHIHFKQSIDIDSDNMDAWNKYTEILVLLKKDMPEAMKLERLHQAIHAEDPLKVAELLTDELYDLKNKAGKTALQLLLDKHEQAFKNIYDLGYPDTHAQKLIPKPVRDIITLLLQKGAETTAREQLIFIKLGIDVVLIKNQLINNLMKTQRQQTLLFKQIEHEQTALKELMKSFSAELKTEVQQETEQLSAKSREQEEIIKVLTQRSETMESSINDLIGALQQSQLQINGLTHTVEQQNQIILQQYQAIMMLTQQANQASIRGIEQAPVSTATESSSTKLLTMPTNQYLASFFSKAPKAEEEYVRTTANQATGLD